MVSDSWAYVRRGEGAISAVSSGDNAEYFFEYFNSLGKADLDLPTEYVEYFVEDGYTSSGSKCSFDTSFDGSAEFCTDYESKATEVSYCDAPHCNTHTGFSYANRNLRKAAEMAMRDRVKFAPWNKMIKPGAISRSLVKYK